MASEMRKTAKFKGHPAEIAEAFSNPDFEIPGLKEKGDILTLDYDKAVEVGLASTSRIRWKTCWNAKGSRGRGSNASRKHRRTRRRGSCPARWSWVS
jgi:hypothetical protein